MNSNNLPIRKYKWRGISQHGKIRSGIINANNIEYVKVFLLDQGITLQKARRIYFHPTPKISNLEITRFFRQLSTLLVADIPILASLSILQSTQDNFLLHDVITKIKYQIASGHRFSQSVLLFPKYFDALVYHLILIGEETGKLDLSISKIALQKEVSLTFKRQILQTLFYPCMILITSITIFLIMLVFIVPRFAELFSNFHHQLPLFTRGILFISHCLRAYWLYSILVFCLAFYFLKEKFKLKNLHLYLLKIPLLNSVIQKIILAQLMQSLVMTTSAGLNLIDSLRLSISSIRHPSYRNAILELLAEISRGITLHAAMSGNPLFPDNIVQMIKIGEESGKLEVMLEKTLQFLNADLDQYISYFKQLLEPTIMLILGVLIGSLVIGMYLPIFKLGSVV